MGRMEWTTPALVVDLAAFEYNLAAAEALLAGTGKLLRPHVKTHGAPYLALRQLGPAAAGVTCATVGEVEAMRGAGITGILLANEIAGGEAAGRIAELARRAKIIVAVDSFELVEAYAVAAVERQVVLEVLVDLDVGLGRCGVADAAEACCLAMAVRQKPGLRFVGLMGYEGRIRASSPHRAETIAAGFAKLATAKAAIGRAGLEVTVVSGAGTSTMMEALACPALTEIQAGCYALMEPDLEGLGLPFRCAASIAASVISRRPGRVVLDAGRRTVGCEYGFPLSLDPRGTVRAVADEHTILEWNGDPPAIGSAIHLRPTQIRTTFNLHRHAWLARAGEASERITVAGRGN